MKLLGGNSPETYLDILHRLYHTWCMFIGFVMVIFTSVQCTIAVFEDFFSNSWLHTNSSPGLALFAAATVSFLIVDVTTSAAVAALFLMCDVWEQSPFWAFRSLLLFQPLSLRVGSSFEELSEIKKKLYHWILMAIYVLLDGVPLLAAILSKKGHAWPASIALVSFAMVLVFWVVDIAHDYWCKARAWSELHVASARTPDSTSGTSAQEEAPATSIMYVDDEMAELQGLPCTHRFWHYLRHNATSRFFSILICVTLLWLLAAVFQQTLLAVIGAAVSLLTIVQVLTDIVHGRFQWCACCGRAYQTKKLLFTVQPKTQEQNDYLASKIGDDFVVTDTCQGDGWAVPANCQLVSDGLIVIGRVCQQMRKYPAGIVYSFRQCAFGAVDIFIEIHCGGSPLQLCGNALVILSWCSLCFAVMLLGRFWLVLFICITGMLVFLLPAIFVFVRPQLAPKAHVFICLLVSVAGMISGMAATRPTSIVFWVMPLLCIFSHCLLHRRFNYKMVVMASLALGGICIAAIFFSQSLGAAYQPPLTSPDQALPAMMAHNFTFNATGARNPYPGPGESRSPVCTLRYPTSDPRKPLDIVDFSFFNKAVYEPDGALQSQLERWMGDWKLVKSVRRELRNDCSTSSDCQTVDWTSWFVFEGSQGALQNTTVVTIRGTKSILETIFDLDLWSLDILKLNTFAARFAGVGHVIDGLWQTKTFGAMYYKWKRSRYASVWNYIKSRLENEPDRIFYITGHSLGGGLSQVIAAQVAAELPSRRISAISISSPGITQTVTKLGLNPDSLQGLSVNIIPKGDPIPTSGGTHAGVNFDIPCLADGLACHRVFNTVCELMRECGDSKRPKRVLPCAFCPLQSARFHENGQAPACWDQKITDNDLRSSQGPWDPRLRTG